MRRRRFLALPTLAAASLAAVAHGASPRALTALVLGGGGCRGYGHVGVLRVLERERLKPDLVVGSSAGSLVGAMWSAGLRSDAIARYGEGMSSNMLRDWVFPRLGIFGGDAIRRFVVDRVGTRRIESLPVRFAAIATDLRTGELVILDRGDLATAVQASSSAPGLVEPVRVGSRMLVDGNLTAPVPVVAARRLGASGVVAVDVSFPPAEADLGDPFDVLYQGFSILTRRLALQERAVADLVIAPALPRHNDMSRATLIALIEAGESAATEALPKLRTLFAAKAG